MTRHSQDIDRLVGLRVAQLRQGAGLSQTALGDRLGISFQQVQKYEKGANRISASRLYQLTEIFGCQVNDLFPPPSDPGHADTDCDFQEAPAPASALIEDRTLAATLSGIRDQSLRQALSQIAVALAKA